MNSQQYEGAPQYVYSSGSRSGSQESAVPPIYSKSVKAVLAKSGPSAQQEYTPKYSAASLASQQYYQTQSEPQRTAYTQQSSNEYASSSSPDAQKVRYFCSNEERYAIYISNKGYCISNWLIMSWPTFKYLLNLILLLFIVDRKFYK